MACILAASMLAILAGCSNGEPGTEVETSSMPSDLVSAQAENSTDTAQETDVRDAEYWEEYYREAPRLEATAFSPDVDGIPYGLKPEELLEVLDQKGIELEPADYSNPDMLPEGIEIIQDGRQYNTANTRFAYSTTKGLSFQYREDDVMDGVYVDNADIPTAEGVKIGDDMETMKDVYGVHCENVYTAFTSYRYFNGEQTLTFDFDEDGKIIRWYIETVDGPEL